MKKEVVVSFKRYFEFAGDNRLFACVETRWEDEDELCLDTAYPVENNTLSADILLLLDRYYSLGAEIVFNF